MMAQESNRKKAQVLGPLSLTWDTQIEFQASGVHLFPQLYSQPQLVNQWIEYVSPSFCLSVNLVNKMNFKKGIQFQILLYQLNKEVRHLDIQKWDFWEEVRSLKVCMKRISNCIKEARETQFDCLHCMRTDPWRSAICEPKKRLSVDTEYSRISILALFIYRTVRNQFMLFTSYLTDGSLLQQL